MNKLLNQKLNNLREFEKKLINNDESSFESFESKIISTNNLIKNDNVESLIFFKKSVFDLMSDREIYDIEKT